MNFYAHTATKPDASRTPTRPTGNRWLCTSATSRSWPAALQSHWVLLTRLTSQGCYTILDKSRLAGKVGLS